MNYPSIRFVFDRKHKADRTHKGLVQVEVLFQRRRKWIGTGVKLYKHQWDERRHVINSPTLIQDNNTLDTIMAHVKEIVHGIIKDTGSFSFSMFNQKIDRAKQKESFLDYVRNDTLRERSDSRKVQYISVYSQLCDFGKIMKFEDLSVKSISEFHNHLVKQGRKMSTIRNYHLILRSIIESAKTDGYTYINPYNDFAIPSPDTEPRGYLTMAEIEKFKAVAVTGTVEISRDFFLVQCYTGLSYSDLLALRRECIEERGEKMVLIGNRIKTGVNYYIVLMKMVIAILEKYDYHFPNINLTTLNGHLRKIAREAGISKTVTSHIGRHTFAVLALSNGVSIETVAKILGHTDIKTTQIYAKIVDSTVEESFEKLELVL